MIDEMGSDLSWDRSIGGIARPCFILLVARPPAGLMRSVQNAWKFQKLQTSFNNKDNDQTTFCTLFFEMLIQCHFLCYSKINTDAAGHGIGRT